MRIAIFTESYEPVPNGVSTSVRTLVDELRATKHHVMVVAPNYPDYEDKSPFVIRVPSLLTPFATDYRLPYPIFPRLRRDFRRVAPNVLHSQSPFFLGLLAARLAKRESIPLVSTYHTLYNHYGHYVFILPDHAVNTLLDWWIPEYYNRCSCIIVPSRVAEQSLRSYGVKPRIVVIPTGVPIPSERSVDEAARMAARDRWNIPYDAPLLMYTGRLAQEKNVELVLDSFAAISAELPEARLLVVGAGPHLKNCQTRAEHMPGGERVIFTGAVPRSELDPVFATADLFVFGSSTETQGLVIAEARAAGTPAVVVDEGGAAETVRHGEDGLVVPSNTEAFTQAVRELMLDRDRRIAMAQCCRINALGFTPSVMAQRVTEVYQYAIEQHAAQPQD